MHLTCARVAIRWAQSKAHI